MPRQTRIATNLQHLQDQIKFFADRYGRNADSIRLIGVSKTKPVALIQEAYSLGLHDFGENYLQEAVDKIEQSAADICWHFVGHIQSNKTRSIAAHFDWVHTLASAKVAKRLNDQRPSSRSPLNVCIQVNISQEASKSGIEPLAVANMVEVVLCLPNLALCGLMAIPAVSADMSTQRRAFSALRELLESVRNTFGDAGAVMQELSMGMTADLEAAIAEGATMVRIGTALFGARESAAREVDASRS